MKKFVIKVVVLFCLGFMLTFPLGFEYLPELYQYTNFLSEKSIVFFAHSIFDTPLSTTKLLSDSKALYIHTFLWCICCIVIASLVEVSERFFSLKIPYSKKTAYWFLAVLRYYLILVLLQYGFAKLFKTQFYLPEPNTLFTPLGFLDKDILYWSVVGSSAFYNYFGGMAEIMVALFLIFRRTYVLGGVLSVLLFSHVVAINIGFNISVKLFSSFLLLISFILIVPQLQSLFYFFLTQKLISKEHISISYPSRKARIIYLSLKSLVVFGLFFITLYPYFLRNSFNDDDIKRPILHGAYEVISNHSKKDKLFINNDTKRIFIHRKKYLITQDYQDRFIDYKINSQSNRINVFSDSKKITFDFFYLNDSTLSLESDQQQIILKKIDWKKLPLLNDTTEWIVE